MLDLQIIRKHNIIHMDPTGRRRYGTTEDHRRFETHGMAEHIMRRIRDLYGDRELVSMTLTDVTSGDTVLEWIPQPLMRLMAELED